MSEIPPSAESEWQLGYAIPNLRLRETFDFGDIAIVGGGDPRMGEIMRSNPAAKALLSGFQGSLGPKGVSSGIVFRNPATFPDLRSAMVDARNCVAVASACFGWITSIGLGNNFGVRYTDYFDFYPRWPSNDGESLRYEGEALSMAFVDCSGFRGETHRYLSTPSFRFPVLDPVLLNTMAKSWRRIHVTARARKVDRRLMRALSVAYEACRVPQAMDNPIFDHGKHCALWVSAFETLSHPGTRVGLKEVLELIGKRPLLDPRLSRRVKMIQKQGNNGKRTFYLNAAQRLYFRLYKARNAFLHGNRLSVRSFVPGCLANGVRLLDAAPLVFYTALEAVVFKRPRPLLDEIEEIFRYKFLEEAFGRALGHPFEEI